MAEVTGGNRLEAALKGMARSLDRADTVRVGFLEGATYPDGTSVAMVAAIQNWGAPSVGIPPRPFFSQLIADKSPEWGPAIGALLVSTGYDAERTLNLTGEAIAGQLRHAITQFVGTPLKPATIRRKGFEKQLVDTGHMLQSVSYEVNV